MFFTSYVYDKVRQNLKKATLCFSLFRFSIVNPFRIMLGRSAFPIAWFKEHHKTLSQGSPLSCSVYTDERSNVSFTSVIMSCLLEHVRYNTSSSASDNVWTSGLYCGKFYCIQPNNTGYNGEPGGSPVLIHSGSDVHVPKQNATALSSKMAATQFTIHTLMPVSYRYRRRYA